MQKKIFIIFTLILLLSTFLTGFLSLSLVTNSYVNEIQKILYGAGIEAKDFIINKDIIINKRLYYYTGFSMLFSLVGALLVGYRFIGRLMEPIDQIIDATKKIANGNFDRRVKVQANDEIGELASNFNHMAEHLENTINQLSDSNTKFKALLTSMINPIIAIDNNGHIILFNESAEELFELNTDEVLGKHILEVIKNNSLDEQLSQVFNYGAKNLSEIKINHPERKILKIYMNPIQLERDPIRTIGTVALIEDITEIRRLEEMRSDFVTNVSHELKTPLTSISGFIETLKSGAILDEKTTMGFLDIIDIETERLKRLINDILTLSEIENIHSNSIKNKIYPNETAMEVVDVILPLAKAKEIELCIEMDPHLPTILGNSDWYKQMLLNLLDNAVKYTPQGGKVQLIAYKRYNKLIITVKDTGLGIPKKDLNRLFERFYRVDKARSRKVGGTGLGLAIVKHIVLSLSGKIEVSSEEGRGTEFTVTIPIK